MIAHGLRARVDPARLYLFMAAAGAFNGATIFTTAAVYRLQMGGLDPLQLVLVGTVMELSILAFEVPTGVVADAFSRRMSIVIGWILLGAGSVFEGSFPAFGTILIGQVIWGLGYTFTSGATDAWLADEVGEERVGPLMLRASQVGRVAGLLGIGASVALSSVQANLPLVLGGLLVSLGGVALALVMPERGFTPQPRQGRNQWQVMADTLRQGTRVVRGKPLLISIIAVAAFNGASTEAIDRLWETHFLTGFALPVVALPGEGTFSPVVWIGVLSAVSHVLGFIAAEVARRRLDTTDHRTVARALLALNVLRIGGLLLVALSGHFWLAVAGFWLAGTMRSVINPVYGAWLVQHIDSRVRATVLSMAGQVDAFGQIAGGPAIGWIGALHSVRAALVAGAVALMPVLPLFARAEGQGAASEDAAEPVEEEREVTPATA